MKEIFGLVVCGGESSRMGMDKSLLVYHQKSQSYHMYEMLDLLCDKVFVSCNKKQASAIPDDYEKIIDLELYQNIGPIAASALQFPYIGKLQHRANFPQCVATKGAKASLPSIRIGNSSAKPAFED